MGTVRLRPGGSNTRGFGADTVEITPSMSETPQRPSTTPPLLGFVEVPAPDVPFGGSSDYMRMLREAQGETSCRTSCGVSPYMSHNSPKSPPNSPTVELTEDLELSDVFINREVPISDFIWDWSSRPNIEPPKQWRLQNVPAKPSSPSQEKKKSQKKISTNFLLTFFLSNVISLIIGAGIGVWLKRKVFKSGL